MKWKPDREDFPLLAYFVMSLAVMFLAGVFSAGGCAARKPARWRFVYSNTRPAPDCVPFREREDGPPEWVCPNPEWHPEK